jgi:hypothetical protein
MSICKAIGRAESAEVGLEVFGRDANNGEVAGRWRR